MLAQNLKTPKQLWISKQTYNALVQVLGLLEREEIPKGFFNMAYMGGPRLEALKPNADPHKCGSAGCIAGWCEAVSPGSYRDKSIPESLNRVFYPGHIHNDEAYGATREQAAFALRTYLTTGKDGWEEAMKFK